MPARPAPLTVLVLAAGQGKRLRSKTIKLLHPVAGQPMVARVLATADALRPARRIVVVGFQAEQVRAALEAAAPTFVVQREQRGTGHAVLQAARQISRRATLLILNGDLPTLRAGTLRRLVNLHRRRKAALTLVTTHLADPRGYGRIVRTARGSLERIVEDRDASLEQRALGEINCGIYCADAEKLLAALRGLRPDNAQGEYYLTDAAQRLLTRGERVETLVHTDAEEVLGVNTRDELARASRTLWARKAVELQESGVTLLDPARTWVDPQARVGRDSVLWPAVVIEGESVLGEDCIVRPGCRITRCRLGRGVEVRDHSVLTDSTVGARARVGPFAHLRPGTVLADEVHIGNFVELKKARLGRGTKASHLSYLGDAEIGEHCNVGAGTITCNYDGERKHLSRMGDRVFIGSDSQLVAPVRLGDDAYVAAGSTVTEDVPSGALAIARGRQRNIKGWVAARRSRR